MELGKKIEFINKPIIKPEIETDQKSPQKQKPRAKWLHIRNSIEHLEKR